MALSFIDADQIDEEYQKIVLDLENYIIDNLNSDEEHTRNINSFLAYLESTWLGITLNTRKHCGISKREEKEQ